MFSIRIQAYTHTYAHPWIRYYEWMHLWLIVEQLLSLKKFHASNETSSTISNHFSIYCHNEDGRETERGREWQRKRNPLINVSSSFASPMLYCCFYRVLCCRTRKYDEWGKAFSLTFSARWNDCVNLLLESCQNMYIWIFFSFPSLFFISSFSPYCIARRWHTGASITLPYRLIRTVELVSFLFVGSARPCKNQLCRW